MAHTPDSEGSVNAITRRSFVGHAAAATLLSAAPSSLAAPPQPKSTFLDLLRSPDAVTAYADLKEPLALGRSSEQWTGHGIDIATKASTTEVSIIVASPTIDLRYIHLRWSMPVDRSILTMGDAWERSYGDLGWRSLIPERVMPWYFSTFDGRAYHCYGVKTGAGSLCFWQLDAEGVSLWLNISNGGSGVQLRQRTLAAATIVTRQGAGPEDGTAAVRAFCRQMGSQPPLPFTPIYGTNDWYYAYGKNSARQILSDTEFISSLSVKNSVRPFSVIDDGWSAGPPAYPDMAQLANDIRARKARPGIWIRPLIATADTDPRLLLPSTRFGSRTTRAQDTAYDPTIPEALERALAKVRQVSSWGYELIKHDYSTYDLLGQWGFEMGADPTIEGWVLHDRTRTNAEVMLDLYTQIRKAGGPERLIIGCNTIGHLAQGLFDIQRTGDDTSGRDWERTRRTGINTLAFRLPQHQSFFIQDADCVGISAAIPWEKNRQWLDVLAQSGTALFISPGEGARTADHAALIRDAFQIVAAGGNAARPASWQQESTPSHWVLSENKTRIYDWCSPEGAYPFNV
jgi:alpha-galactosidase